MGRAGVAEAFRRVPFRFVAAAVVALAFALFLSMPFTAFAKECEADAGSELQTSAASSVSASENDGRGSSTQGGSAGESAASVEAPSSTPSAAPSDSSATQSTASSAPSSSSQPLPSSPEPAASPASSSSQSALSSPSADSPASSSAEHNTDSETATATSSVTNGGVVKGSTGNDDTATGATTNGGATIGNAVNGNDAPSGTSASGDACHDVSPEATASGKTHDGNAREGASSEAAAVSAAGQTTADASAANYGNSAPDASEALLGAWGFDWEGLYEPSVAYAVYDSQSSALVFSRARRSELASLYGTCKVYTGFEGATYNIDSEVPWADLRGSVVGVVFNGSVSPVSTANWFAYCDKLAMFDDCNMLDMSRAVSAGNMFYGCSSLREVNMTGWNVGSLRNVSGMFGGCPSLQKVQGFDSVMQTLRAQSVQVAGLGDLEQIGATQLGVEPPNTGNGATGPDDPTVVNGSQGEGLIGIPGIGSSEQGGADQDDHADDPESNPLPASDDVADVRPAPNPVAGNGAYSNVANVTDAIQQGPADVAVSQTNEILNVGNDAARAIERAVVLPDGESAESDGAAGERMGVSSSLGTVLGLLDAEVPQNDAAVPNSAQKGGKHALKDALVSAIGALLGICDTVKSSIDTYASSMDGSSAEMSAGSPVSGSEYPFAPFVAAAGYLITAALMAAFVFNLR